MSGMYWFSEAKKLFRNSLWHMAPGILSFSTVLAPLYTQQPKRENGEELWNLFILIHMLCNYVIHILYKCFANRKKMILLLLVKKKTRIYIYIKYTLLFFIV